MADTATTAQELDWSRQLAQEKFDLVKAGRRQSARREYYGRSNSAPKQDLGRSVVEDLGAGLDGDDNGARSIPQAVEQNTQLQDFRETMPERARRFGQLQAARAERRGASADQAAQIENQSASAFARQAYTRVWQLAEEGVQDFALSFADFMLISGPASVAIFLTRLVGGNLMGGAGTVDFKGVTVPRVPGYSTIEGPIRAGKIFFIGIISGLIYVTIFLLIAALTNPDLVIQLGLCSVFDPILKFIGVNVCAA